MHTTTTMGHLQPTQTQMVHARPSHKNIAHDTFIASVQHFIHASTERLSVTQAIPEHSRRSSCSGTTTNGCTIQDTVLHTYAHIVLASQRAAAPAHRHLQCDRTRTHERKTKTKTHQTGASTRHCLYQHVHLAQIPFIPIIHHTQFIDSLHLVVHTTLHQSQHFDLSGNTSRCRLHRCITHSLHITLFS